MIFGVVIVVFLGFSYFNRVEVKSPKPWVPQTDTCGIESCHGLDITCGANVPEACTLEYQAGDRCRQFVSCETVEGHCSVQKSSRFDECVECVVLCDVAYPDDLESFFQCESTCGE